MATKKQKQPTANRVWIEVERPRDAAHAEEVCKRLNNVLQRLSPATSFKFWWNERKALYALTTDEAGGFIILADNGHWFNLDYFGRDDEPGLSPKEYWLHVEDLADAYIGPFNTPRAALAHYDWTKTRGDGAVLKSISDQAPPKDHPLVLTREQDRALVAHLVDSE